MLNELLEEFILLSLFSLLVFFEVLFGFETSKDTGMGCLRFPLRLEVVDPIDDFEMKFGHARDTLHSGL